MFKKLTHLLDFYPIILLLLILAASLAHQASTGFENNPLFGIYGLHRRTKACTRKGKPYKRGSSLYRIDLLRHNA